MWDQPFTPTAENVLIKRNLNKLGVYHFTVNRTCNIVINIQLSNAEGKRIVDDLQKWIKKLSGTYLVHSI